MELWQFTRVVTEVQWESHSFCTRLTSIPILVTPEWVQLTSFGVVLESSIRIFFLYVVTQSKGQRSRQPRLLIAFPTAPWAFMNNLCIRSVASSSFKMVLLCSVCKNTSSSELIIIKMWNLLLSYHGLDASDSIFNPCSRSEVEEKVPMEVPSTDMWMSAHCKKKWLNL